MIWVRVQLGPLISSMGLAYVPIAHVLVFFLNIWTMHLQGDPTYLVVENDKTLATYGINAVCTHLGCVVPWNKAENKFICPCHGSQYNNQGTVVRGPAPLVWETFTYYQLFILCSMNMLQIHSNWFKYLQEALSFALEVVWEIGNHIRWDIV